MSLTSSQPSLRANRIALLRKGKQLVWEPPLLNGSNPPTVSYSLIREVLRLYHRTGEKLIITFAMPAYAKMVMNFGRFAMPQVGEPFYAHRNNDPRTSNDLLLVPSIVEPSNFLENISRGVVTADDGPTARRRFATLCYMTDGLDDYFMPLTRQVLSEGIQDI